MAQTYEYLIVDLTNFELDKKLNEFGAQGWHVVDVSPYGRFILERPALLENRGSGRTATEIELEKYMRS